MLKKKKKKEKKNTEEEGTHQYSFYKASVTLTPKPNKNTTTQENHRLGTLW